MGADKPNERATHPWPFMSTRYGRFAEDRTIAEHEASGEFLSEQGVDLNGVTCPNCCGRNVTGPYDRMLSCGDCGERWEM